MLSCGALAADQGHEDIVVHSYSSVAPETTWEIITNDIPDLKRYVQVILKNDAPFLL